MAKLLIVDDEVDVREFATNFFRKRKIEVITVSNGEEALGIVEKQKVNLVLLDITMCGIDGIETLKRIKELDKNAKVIMVTGKKAEDKDSCNKCHELGAIDYIHKPLELDELEKTVLGALNQNKQV